MVVGVMGMDESNAAARLGIDLGRASPREREVKLARSHDGGGGRRELTAEDDIMLECVMLVGTICRNDECAQLIANSYLIKLL